MAIPEGWQPYLDKEKTRRLIKEFDGREGTLTKARLDDLEYHAQHHNLPFYTGDFSILEAIKQAGAGFVEGFTTLNIADHPDNEYEQIFRNLGHLAGFAPSLMAAPLKAAGAANLAAKVSAIKSIPMKGADIVTKYAKTKIKATGLGFTGRSEALKTVNNFYLGEKAKHIVEGAFHLGTASAISSWKGGVDEMVHGFIGGAKAGGMFRAIGNLTPGTAAHERIGKAMAGSLFLGLPSTMRGATTPEQVYEYAMGAFFGGNEVSWSRAKAGKFMQKMVKKAQIDSKWATTSGMDPEFHSEYKDLPEPVKPILKEMAKEQWGDADLNRAMGFLLASEMGEGDKITAETLKLAGFEQTEEFVEGERVYRLKAEELPKYKSFVMSGGAGGADTQFAKAADAVGIPSIHYTFGKHQKGIKAPGFKRILSLSELEDVNSDVEVANQSLNRNIGNTSDYVKNLIRRSVYQAKFSDSVYAVGEVSNDAKQVKGGTGWAVQVGIDQGKPVHVFDQVRNQWFSWNKAANRFTTIVGQPPRPSARFAGIGTRKLNKAGKKAINDLFGTYWAPSTTAAAKVSTIAKKSPQIARAKKRLIKISNDKADIEQKITDIGDELVVAEKGGATNAELDTIASPLENLSARHEKLTEEQNRLANIGVDLETTAVPKNTNPDIKKINEETADLTDADFEVPGNLEVGKRSLQFTNKHLSTIYKGIPVISEIPRVKLEVAQKINDILKTKDANDNYVFLRPGSKENLSESWASAVEKQLSADYGKKVELSSEARGDMRQWMTRKNTGKLVKHLQSDGINVFRMAADSNPRSLAGNRKHQEEPEKRIDVTFREQGGGDEPAYLVLDHVTVKTDKGNRDLDLSRYRNSHLLRLNKYDKEASDKSYNSFISKSMRFMDSDKGGNYYYFSGRGDGDKIHWVKYHPQINKVNTQKSLKTFIKEATKVDKGFENDYKSAKREFLAKYATKNNRKSMEELFEKQYLSNVFYDLSMNKLDITPENISKILGEGFINKSSAFNKRAQIWFSNGWSGDKEFLKNSNISLNKNDNYNYLIVNDLTKEHKKLDHKLVELLNNQNPEHVDGAIIVRDDVINAINKDFGVPESGQNKSFIVSPSAVHGALLGKFMFHSAGKQMTAHMKKNNLHMIMQESAVKQHGTRKIGDYEVDSKGLDLKGSEIYELNPEEVLGSFGVYGSKHMLSNQRIPKQLLSNLVPNAFKEVDQKIINDMFEEVIGSRWKGEEGWNKAISDYLGKLSEGKTSAEELKALESDIENNLEKIGIMELVSGMKAEYADGLNEAIYNKILKLDKNWVTEEFREGRISESEYKEYNENVSEFTSVVDRMLKAANEWATAERAGGRDMSASAMYMHKFVRDFRMKSVQNFLLNSATKPKRENSISAFMRPYDKAMQGNIDNINDLLNKNNAKGINKKDDLFFLDSDFGTVMINTGIKGIGRVSLENLWNISKNKKGKEKEAIDEIFTAVTMRVPMDSISGAQIAKFGGFTGRKGHGILIHSKAMRAEGGADLDGDKSFVFFGGQGGFKKSWKDAYLQNKEEFYKGKGNKRTVSDNKQDIVETGKNKGKKFSEVLGLSLSANQEREFNSKAFQYSPGERIRISQAAVDGRNLLGPAVTQKQVLSAAYNAIVAGGGEDTFTAKKKVKGKWYDYEIKIKAKTSKSDQRHQRGMGRAQVGLASDPLDVLGLKGQDAWFSEMWDAHFEIVGGVKKTSGQYKWSKLSAKEQKELVNLELISGNQLKGGIFSDFLDMNKAYWGRNWAEGRKYNMHEIRALGSSIYNINLNPDRVNTVMAKTGELFHGLDWSDSIFGRLNENKVEAIYNKHVQDLEKYDWLKRILGRSTFKTPMGQYIESTMKNRLWTEDGLNTHSKSVKLFKKAVKGTLFAKNKDLMTKALKSEAVRKDVLIQIKNLGEDFIVNDMTDLTTLNNVSNIVEQMISEKDIGVKGAKNINEAIEQIHKRVEFLKRNSYLMARDRKTANAYDIDQLDILPKEQRDALRELYELAWGESTKKRKIREIGEDITAEMDQLTIDNDIIKFKESLTENGEKLFDQLMLGSLNRFDIGKIDDVVSRVSKWDKPALDLVHNLRSQAAKTSISKLGFNSNSISDNSIKEHIGSYLNNFNEMWRKPSDESINKTTDNVNKAINNPKNQAQGIPETEFNEFINKAMLHTGYEGLKEGDLGPKTKSIVTEIATMLKTYNNKVGQNLNELTRGLDFIGKDLNAMNKQDFVHLRNWLHEMKRGGFVQRMFGKKGPVELAKRHWALFPEAINRELMRDELVLMRERGFFTDKLGNVREGPIVRPTNYVDIVQNWISRMTDASTGTADRFIKEFQERTHFHTGIEDSNALWTIAVRSRELRDKGRIMSSDKTSAEKAAIIKEMHIRLNEANKEFNYDKELKNKKYFVTLKNKRRELTGEEIVKEIDDALENTFNDMYRLIEGEPGALDPYIVSYNDPVSQQSPIIDYKKFIRHLQSHLVGGPSPWKDIARQDIPRIFGIDGLRIIARSMMLDTFPNTKEGRALKKKIALEPVISTGEIRDGYFPHMFFETKQASKIMNNAIKKIMETPDSDMSPEVKNKEMKKIIYRHKALDGDWTFKDMEEYEQFDKVLEEIAEGKRTSEENIKWFNANERAGSMKSRTADTGGHSIDPTVVEAYIRSLSNTYYRQLSQMFSRHIIDRMGKEMPKKWGLEQSRAWQNFMKLYAQDAMGNPSVVPQRLYDDPKMKLKGTPYAWWADNRVRDRINKIGATLGITDKKLPEELRGIDLQTLRNWSNLEAQFQMASLLAHPKSMVANVLGGTLHTIQNAGLGNFVKARNYQFLSKINPEWNNKEAVNDFVISQGVVPEFMLYEMGLQKGFQNTKGESFLRELSQKMTRDPDMSETTVGEIANKYGLKDRAVNFASKFMSVPERMLRRDSFMAHYIHAWQKYGGAIKEFDHPFLIEMAKKGVKATQFLYNAPNRPAFARTALGKVMSRFQLWAWNSVRFRNDVKRQGRVYGFSPGSEAAKRYERTLQLDLFTFALANMFAYSLFESNLPQPWGWAQDWSDWIFGDEKERDKAFYGSWPTKVAPLQMITPPGFRMIGPTFDAMLSDDWSRIAQYHIYTMFPFGRMARDVSPLAKGNLLENPSRLPEKLFGFPMRQIQTRITKSKKEREEDKNSRQLYTGSYKY